MPAKMPWSTRTGACARTSRLLTPIAPRHRARDRRRRVRPRRAERGLALARRTAGCGNRHVADTVGELGLIYRLTPGGVRRRQQSATAGESDRGGETSAAILHGPHVCFVRSTLRSIARTAPRSPTQALTASFGAWLGDPAARARVADAARTTVDALGGALERTLQSLEPYLMQLRLRQRGDHA
jgi:3-deoxy-D-manno-octulosonic-acid transferase